MKSKSTLIFVICIIVIVLLDFTGAKGFDFAGYRFNSLGETIKRGLDLKGGVSVVEEIVGNNPDSKTLDRTVELLSLRVNKLGISETAVTKEGNNRIRIEVPGVYDTKTVIESVAKTGLLTFKDPSGAVILTGQDVSDASAYIDQSNQPTISLVLNDSGTKKFATATQKFINQRISIYMDEDMLTNPTVNAVITDGKAIITGSKTLDEAKRQAGIIKSGALPVTLKTASASVVGPTLGAEATPQSVKAGMVGLGIIFLFMTLYYRVPGLIASFALALFTVLVLGTFSMIGATLTLAGIAGFLLTVGMAVDANVLIFERVKEELKAGKTVKSAIHAGFHRAMPSIIDSNASAIISGLVLYSLGSGTVKGFALTLIIGVILSMITAIFVTRLLMNLAADMGLFKQKWTIGTFGVHEVKRG